jgi:hypothetical protein
LLSHRGRREHRDIRTKNGKEFHPASSKRILQAFAFSFFFLNLHPSEDSVASVANNPFLAKLLLNIKLIPYQNRHSAQIAPGFFHISLQVLPELWVRTLFYNPPGPLKGFESPQIGDPVLRNENIDLMFGMIHMGDPGNDVGGLPLSGCGGQGKQGDGAVAGKIIGPRDSPDELGTLYVARIDLALRSASRPELIARTPNRLIISAELVSVTGRKMKYVL